jgi:hypothetical protein
MDENAKQKAGIKRTTLILGIIAFAFYFGFIYLGVGRS